jgi:hypothetical protein
LNGPAAPSFSECDVISVASMSMTIPIGGRARVPGVLARPRARTAQRVQQRRVAGDRIDDPEGSGVGGDLAEQRLLIADGAQVRKAVAAVGEHHRHVPHDAAGIMAAAPLAHRRQALRERARESEAVGRPLACDRTDHGGVEPGPRAASVAGVVRGPRGQGDGAGKRAALRRLDAGNGAAAVMTRDTRLYRNPADAA